jgi:hypothetical protein
MSEKRRATIEEAKAAWDAYPPTNRSIRVVIKELEKQNLTCNVATLQRWRQTGFTLKKQPKIKDPEAVHAAAQRVMEKIAGKHKADDELARTMRADQQSILAAYPNDAELARLAAREKLATQIVLARCISENAGAIALERPGVAIGLFEVLNTPIAPVVVAAQPGGNGDDARVVEGTVINKSESALAIERFLAKEGVAA